VHVGPKRVTPNPVSGVFFHPGGDILDDGLIDRARFLIGGRRFFAGDKQVIAGFSPFV